MPHRKVGKWIFAKHQDEVVHLEKIKTNADSLGVPLSFLSSREVKEGEPNLKAHTVLHSPETGILDTHSYFTSLSGIIEENEGKRDSFFYLLHYSH